MITNSQADILDHTIHRAAGGFYCGRCQIMDELVAAGLMEFSGHKFGLEYFNITHAGRVELKVWNESKNAASTTPRLQERRDGGALMQRMVRRWRRARPHCGGWWEWMENGSSRVEKLLLVPCGSEVAGDDAWEQETGKPAEHDGSVENYWESTQTTQKMMPGLWRQCPPARTTKLCDSRDSRSQRLVRPLVGDEWELKRPGKRKIMKQIGEIYVRRFGEGKDERGRVRARKWAVRWKRQPKGRCSGCTLRQLMLYGRRISTAAERRARYEAIACPVTSENLLASP